MSHNYDNWEKLVRKVLQREHDRYLAMLDDLPSECGTSFASSSSQLSFGSAIVSSANESCGEIPIDYSDLMANHTDWKALLPHDQEEVVWSSASLSFSIDKRTRKNSFMVGARELTLSRDYMTEMTKNSRSRFSEVSEIGFEEGMEPRVTKYTSLSSYSEDLAHSEYSSRPHQLFEGSMSVIIQGSMAMERLSPNTLYGVFIVFDFKAFNQSSNSSMEAIYGSCSVSASVYNVHSDTKNDNYDDTYSYGTESTNNDNYDDVYFEVENNNDVGIDGDTVYEDVEEVSSERLFESVDPLLGSSSVGARGDKHFSGRNSVNLDVVNRADGWKEVELGSCYIGEEQSGFLDAVLELSPINNHLLVEGFEFRPCSGTEPFQVWVEVAPKKVGFLKSIFLPSKLFG